MIQPSSFSLFPKLPSEIRLEIWRHALNTQDWALTRPRFSGDKIVLGGNFRRAVGQACRESRDAMRNTFVDAGEGFGLLDFSRHLVYFRNEAYAPYLLDMSFRQEGIMKRVEHLVLNPSSQSNLWDVIERVKTTCSSLKTLTVVAPWAFTKGVYREEFLSVVKFPTLEWFSPWDSIFLESLFEIDASPVVRDIETREGLDLNSTADETWEDGQLDYGPQTFRELREMWPQGQVYPTIYGDQAVDPVVQDLKTKLLDFPTPPRLYLKKTGDLMSLRCLSHDQLLASYMLK